MKMLHILMISPQFRPILGGYERAAERLALALVSQGHFVHVFSERRDRTWPSKEYFDGVTLRRWWCLYRPRLHILSSMIGLVACLLRYGRQFQVWHVHQYGIHAAVAILLGKVMGRPVVMKLTSSSDQGLSRMVLQSRMPGLMAAILRRVDAVVALTNETLNEAIKFGIPGARVHLLGNGVDTKRFAPATHSTKLAVKDALGLGLSAVMLYVGRLAAEKNPIGLLLVWDAIRGRMAGDWKLVMVGDGPLREAIESLVADRALSDKVIIAGRQDYVDQWMIAADLYVLPSQREGLSNALLEAMAVGLPVVATRVSGVTELVEETGAGLVVDVGDMHALGQSMIRLGCDPDMRADMRIRARQAVEDRFSIEKVVADHESLYWHLLAENSH